MSDQYDNLAIVCPCYVVDYATQQVDFVCEKIKEYVNRPVNEDGPNFYEVPKCPKLTLKFMIEKSKQYIADVVYPDDWTDAVCSVEDNPIYTVPKVKGDYEEIGTMDHWAWIATFKDNNHLGLQEQGYTVPGMQSGKLYPSTKFIICDGPYWISHTNQDLDGSGGLLPLDVVTYSETTIEGRRRSFRDYALHIKGSISKSHKIFRKDLDGDSRDMDSLLNPRKGEGSKSSDKMFSMRVFAGPSCVAGIEGKS